jgi:glycosyltransferase involved in cell wall biosynthesis
MSTNKPLVSLCCSTFSRPDLFRESLSGLLRQTYYPLEIVVLVDGGNPSSIRILEEHADPRLHWFTTEKPSGMIAAWNSVVSRSKGKYFLYCADDDVLLDSAVDRQIDCLEQNRQVGFCHADFYLIDDQSNRIGDWRSHEGNWIKKGLSEWEKYLRQPRCCMQTTVVRRELWDKVGGWDEDAGYPGDNSLYLKLLRISDVGHISHYACNYRVRTQTPDSWIKNSSKVKEDIILARKHLDIPPNNMTSRIGHLRRKVNQHFCLNALSVLADNRGTSSERLEFIDWLTKNLLYHEGLNFLPRLLIKFRLESLAHGLQSIQFKLRRFIRRALGILKISYSKE